MIPGLGEAWRKKWFTQITSRTASDSTCLFWGQKGTMGIRVRSVSPVLPSSPKCYHFSILRAACKDSGAVGGPATRILKNKQLEGRVELCQKSVLFFKNHQKRKCRSLVWHQIRWFSHFFLFVFLLEICICTQGGLVWGLVLFSRICSVQMQASQEPNLISRGGPVGRYAQKAHSQSPTKGCAFSLIPHSWLDPSVSGINHFMVSDFLH